MKKIRIPDFKSFGIRAKLYGMFCFGLSMGLIDEIPHNNVPGCYQFPYATGMGCLPFQHAYEIAYILVRAITVKLL